jgi:hypothetical protein
MFAHPQIITPKNVVIIQNFGVFSHHKKLVKWVQVGYHEPHMPPWVTIY